MRRTTHAERTREQRDARNETIEQLSRAVQMVQAYVDRWTEEPADFVGLLPDLRNVALRFEQASAPEDP